MLNQAGFLGVMNEDEIAQEEATKLAKELGKTEKLRAFLQAQGLEGNPEQMAVAALGAHVAFYLALTTDEI